MRRLLALPALLLVTACARASASTSTAAGTAQAATEPRTAWVGNQETKYFFKSSCASAREIPDAQRVWFASDVAAVDAGYQRSRRVGC